jgi:small subunit ribosomal protein S1
MANEVNNETEETAQNAASVSEQTNTNDSAQQQAPAEETSAAATSGADTQASHEEDFGSILEKFEQEQTIFHNGDVVEGKVVGVSDRGVMIDFGYKSEGFAPIEDFTSPAGEVSVNRGDTVEVTIKNIATGDAPPVLSHADAITRKSWETIEKAFNEETPITGRVIDVTKGGLRVDLDGVEAFLPGSQVDSRPIRNLNSFVGQDIEAKIIKFSRKRNNIVLSRKVLTDEVVNKQKSETLGNIEEGFVIEGTVKNLTEYGAFVDIGGIDGLLHVTDMSWGRLQNPGEHFKVNDHVQVKVLKLDRQKEKVALGYKQLVPDPWSTVIEIYPINSKIKGRVSSVTDYGAFIELEPGVEGLVHVSEMSWSKRSQSPKRLLRAGDEVEVQVLGIDTDDRRISLGMKQLQPNPWQTVHERYRVGQTVSGKVRNLTDFGAFIEIEDGIDGLVHVSDITWSKKVKHPKDVLKRDQEVQAVIKNIDTDNRRMSLSIKELTPSAWDAFVSTHKPGDVVRGRISRFTGFGVFVELGNDLEGLCHISELSDERVERPEDIGEVGQEMDFKILRIEQDVQKIGLSHRAVGKEEEPVMDTKSYSTEAKSGMASLGELMNLKRGGEEEGKEDQPRLSKKERRALQAQERAEQEIIAAQAPAAETADQNTETTGEGSDIASSETGVEENGGQQQETSAEQSPENSDSAAATTDETVTAAESRTDGDATPDQQTIQESAASDAEEISLELGDATETQSQNNASDSNDVLGDLDVTENAAGDNASTENSTNSTTTDTAASSESNNTDSTDNSEEKTAIG